MTLKDRIEAIIHSKRKVSEETLRLAERAVDSTVDFTVENREEWAKKLVASVKAKAD